jgi:hypothetical protein
VQPFPSIPNINAQTAMTTGDERFGGFAIRMAILAVSTFVLFFLTVPASACGTVLSEEDSREPLIVIAIGNAGTSGSILRGNSSYISEMYTGQHDAGRFQALLFLGDNFTPTGLNVPAASVPGEIASSLGPFKEPMEGLGKARVHAIPGEHDYYARNALESSVFFGLIKHQEGPSGMSDKGNMREAEIPGWTYHHGLPGRLTLPLVSGSADSAEFIFFDSGRLLRSEPSTWRPVLDSLRWLLVAEREQRGIDWRILCTHHPLASVGEHGGYSVWNDDEKVVEYLTPCDRDSNPSEWVKNWLDPEDLCTSRYQQYIDSLTAAIRFGGVPVQAVLSAHDRSLQLLDTGMPGANYPDCPRVQIISGAGSETGRVKFPVPPHEFTAALRLPSDEGLSAPGFVQMCFSQERVRLHFYSGKSGNAIDMGGGQTEFWIDREGKLLLKEK